MIKKGFYLFLALFGLAVSAVPAMKQNKVQEVKADNSFTVTAVSNQNVAGGYGLGLAIEFSPYLDAGYWQPVDVGGKIHLYNAEGTEVALPHSGDLGAVEEVGQQLCIGRGCGVDYNGYSIKFDADLSFTLSSGTTWNNSEEKTFYCYGANGATGYYWETAPYNVVAVSAVSNQNVAGGYGLGLALEFNPVLDGGYWQGVDFGDKVHLYNASGEEVALPHSDGLAAFEEVGQQLCLGRGCGVDYKGFVLTFEKGLTFTLSSGSKYIIADTISFKCNLDNGVTGQYWDVYTPVVGTPVAITGISNQNIAGGYGLGLALEFDPVLDGGYWQGVDFGDKVHMFNASGEEVALPHSDGLAAFEEVGQQLCLGRGCGVDYKGYSLVFEEGLSFTLSSGTTYVLNEAITFDCNLDNGVTGQYWTVHEDKVATEIEVKAVSNQNVAGGYGLGLAIEFSSDLDGGYWQAVSFSGGVHLFNAEGTEVALPQSGDLPAFEEVGQQLCLGRGAGCDYNGFKLTFEKGAQFTLSSGTLYEVSKTVTFICNLENGVTGQYWEIYLPEAIFEYKDGYSFGNNSDWGEFYIVFSNIQDIGHYVSIANEPLADIASHVFVNSKNNVVKNVLQLGGGRYEFWFNEGEAPAKAGDTITITKGLSNYQFSGQVSNFAPVWETGEYVATNVLKEDIKFVFDGTSYHEFIGEPTDFTFTGKESISIGEEAETTITLVPEGTYATASYESSDANIVRVDAAGKMTGVAEGSATISATIGEVTKSISVTVLPEKDIKGVQLVGVYNYYSVLLDSDPSEFHPTFSAAKLVFEDDTTSAEIALAPADVVIAQLDTSVEGEVELAVQVTVNEVVYNTSITVNVYSLYDQKVSEVGIVDWFAYATFIQFTNTSTNKANFTSNEFIPLIEYANMVHYTKHDGTSIDLGFYLLAENLALFPQFTDESGSPVTLNEENYNKYYEVGDMITIDANTPMYKWTGNIFDAGGQGSPIAGTGEAIIEGYVKNEITYRYDGNVWGLYIPYTDMELGSTQINLNIGESASANATRVPANATTGKFEYVSSDTNVATVSPNGVIKGVGEGTCTITVTLSENGQNSKTGTITVTVNDVLTGIEIRGEIKVKQGTAEVDLSNIEAYYVWASGKQGERVDLSNATISGLDASQTGEQTVVISVLVNGQTVSGTTKINVYAEAKKACGGSITATSVILSAMALAGVALLLKKKHE